MQLKKFCGKSCRVYATHVLEEAENEASRLIEIWLPFNAHPGVGWGQGCECHGCIKPNWIDVEPKEATYVDKYLVHWATFC